MAHGNFEFKGLGGSFLWLAIWTSILTSITLGIYGPWAYCHKKRWLAANTYIDGQQLVFKGTGGSAFGLFLLVFFLSLITFGIYIAWGYCRIQRWLQSNTYYADPGDVEVTS